MKTKLLIVHLVDSRKSKSEIQSYIDSFTKHEQIDHAIIFGGNPAYRVDVSVSNEVVCYTYRNPFQCSEAWYKGLWYFFVDRPVEDIHYYVNVRDMDDIYDDEQMAKELPLENNVGVIRFNCYNKFNGNVSKSTYGNFLGDYFIKDWNTIKYAPEGIKTLQDAIYKEPHMIRRQFAIVDEDVIKDMLSYYYTPMNKGEDTAFLMRAYVCSLIRGLGIKIAGSVYIGTYNRDAGNMSAGGVQLESEWYKRFVEFQMNIHNDFNIFLHSSFPTLDVLPKVHRLLSWIQLERTEGNARSLEYHVNALRKAEEENP